MPADMSPTPPVRPSQDTSARCGRASPAGWGEHAAFIDARGAAVSAAMLQAIAPQPGDRVLELACGPGGARPRGGAARRAPAARSCCPTSRPR